MDGAGDARGVSIVAEAGAVDVVDVALLSSKGAVGVHGEGLLLALWFLRRCRAPLRVSRPLSVGFQFLVWSSDHFYYFLTTHLDVSCSAPFAMA